MLKDRVLTGQVHWLNAAKSAFLAVACSCAVSMLLGLSDVFHFCNLHQRIWGNSPTAKDTAPPMLLTSDSRETVQPAELDVVLLTRPLDHTLLVLTANKYEQPGI